MSFSFSAEMEQSSYHALVCSSTHNFCFQKKNKKSIFLSLVIKVLVQPQDTLAVIYNPKQTFVLTFPALFTMPCDYLWRDSAFTLSMPNAELFSSTWHDIFHGWWISSILPKCEKRPGFVMRRNPRTAMWGLGNPTTPRWKCSMSECFYFLA